MINAVGLFIIVACVFGSFILSGGKMDIVLHALPHEMLAICGAALGAFLVGNSIRTVKLAGTGLKRAFKGPRWNGELYRDLLTLLFTLFTTFKKKGATGIEPHLDDPAASPIWSRFPGILADHHLVEFICDYLATGAIFASRAVDPADGSAQGCGGSAIGQRHDADGRTDRARDRGKGR